MSRRLVVVTDGYLLVANYLWADDDHEHACDWLSHPVGRKRLDQHEATVAPAA